MRATMIIAVYLTSALVSVTTITTLVVQFGLVLVPLAALAALGVMFIAALRRQWRASAPAARHRMATADRRLATCRAVPASSRLDPVAPHRFVRGHSSGSPIRH